MRRNEDGLTVLFVESSRNFGGQERRSARLFGLPERDTLHLSPVREKAFCANGPWRQVDLVLAAMAAGVRVVATKVGGLAEIVTDVVDGARHDHERECRHPGL